MRYLLNLLEKIEKSTITFPLWSISFLALIGMRIMVEHWIAGFPNKSALNFFYNFSHTFLFFLLSFLVLLFLLKKITGMKISNAANILTTGLLIILTPPIFDRIISGGKLFWSFYEFDGIKGLFVRFFTFFGENPEMGITYGVRIEVALALLFLGGIIYLKTRRLFLSFFSIILLYLTFFILGTFPSWITLILKGFGSGFFNIASHDVAAVFLTPFSIFTKQITDMVAVLNIKMSLVYAPLISVLILSFLYTHHKEKLLIFIANIRPPQIIFHWSVFLMGILLGFALESPTWSLNFFNILGIFILMESILLAWISSVVFNDITDLEIDKISNTERPLVKNIFSHDFYLSIGVATAILSVFLAALVNFKIAGFIFLYFLLAWAYSSWPLRLKRWPIIATLLSAAAILLVFFSGYILTSADQTIANIPASIILLLIINYTASLPLKDFKDMEGDKKNGIFTLPVIFGEFWSRIIIGSGIFFSFIFSVIVLTETILVGANLFWWALFFGGLSFWIVQKTKDFKLLPWWILATVGSYGLIIILIYFS